jgi:hypothetical protein
LYYQQTSTDVADLRRRTSFVKVTCASSSSLQNERRKSRLNSSIRPWIVLGGDGAIVTVDTGSPPAACVALRQHAEANLIRALATGPAVA